MFPSSDIYDGLGAVYDYGQMGVGTEKTSKILVGQHGAVARKHRYYRLCYLYAPNLEGKPDTWMRFNDPLIDNRDSKNVIVPMY